MPADDVEHVLAVFDSPAGAQLAAQHDLGPGIVRLVTLAGEDHGSFMAKRVFIDALRAAPRKRKRREVAAPAAEPANGPPPDLMAVPA